MLAFAIIIGITCLILGEKADPFVRLCEAVDEISVKIVSAVMYTTPVGVFCSLAGTVHCQLKEYNVSTLILILKDIIADTQITTGRIVLESVTKHQSVNVDVNDKMISNLLSDKNRKEIHGDIKSGACRKEVMDFARNRIEKTLMPRISPLRMDDFCSQVIDAMTADKKVSDPC